MNTQHQRRKNNNTLKYHERSAREFRFQFSFEIRQRRWMGNSLRQTVPHVCGLNWKRMIANCWTFRPIGMTRAVVDDNNRRRQETTWDALQSSDDRYDGAIPCWQRNASTAITHSIICGAFATSADDRAEDLVTWSTSGEWKLQYCDWLKYAQWPTQNRFDTGHSFRNSHTSQQWLFVSSLQFNRLINGSPWYTCPVGLVIYINCNLITCELIPKKSSINSKITYIYIQVHKKYFQE